MRQDKYDFRLQNENEEAGECSEHDDYIRWQLCMHGQPWGYLHCSRDMAGWLSDKLNHPLRSEARARANRSNGKRGGRPKRLTLPAQSS